MHTKIQKILLAGLVGGDSFTENIVYTLSHMGYDVIFDNDFARQNRNSRVKNIWSEFREKTSLNYITSSEQWLIHNARMHNPDLLLAPTTVVKENSLHEIRKAGVRYCVAWWGDSPGNMKRMGLLSDQWDFIFFKDPDVVRKFRLVGLNAYVLHEAMNPDWHKPVCGQKNENVVVAGNFYGFRQYLLGKLMENDVPLELYGGRLPLWIHPEIQKQHTRKYIIKEEKSRIFGSGMACLNSTQIIEGNSMNCRAFEIAGAGGLHLMEWRPIIEECFEPGKEVLTFRTFDELMGHIERAQKFPQEMVKIRDAAARRAHAEHTYQHRLETIFSYLKRI